MRSDEVSEEGIAGYLAKLGNQQYVFISRPRSNVVASHNHNKRSGLQVVKAYANKSLKSSEIRVSV